MNDIKTLIIDNGSNTLRAGFSGDDRPTISFPSNIEITIGNTHEVISPIERGIITRFDCLQTLYEHLFSDLKVDSSQNSFLITEPILNPKMVRQKLTELMFETFNAPSFFLANQCTLSILSSGRTTGFALDVGHGVSQFSPVYECYTQPHGSKRIDLGGQDLTDWMLKMLSEENGYDFNSVDERKTIEKLKEKNVFVALDYETEIFNSKNSPSRPIICQMPNGTNVELTSEVFRCPELLFKPQLNGRQCNGIERELFDSLNLCCVELRKKLYENIVVVGGSSYIRGFCQRLKKEICELNWPSVETKIVSGFPESKCAAWFGGSLLSNFRDFQQMVIMRFEYEENGSNCVNTKCLL